MARTKARRKPNSDSNSNNNNNGNFYMRNNENWVRRWKPVLLQLNLNTATGNNKNFALEPYTINRNNLNNFNRKYFELGPQKIKQMLFKNMINAVKNKNFKSQAEIKRFFLTNPAFKNRSSAYLKAFPFSQPNTVKKTLTKENVFNDIKNFVKNKNIYTFKRGNLSRYLHSLNKYKNYNISNMKALVKLYSSNNFESMMEKTNNSSSSSSNNESNSVPDLETMTVKALQDYADSQGIIYLKSAKKSDLISVIKRGSKFNKMQTTNLMKLATNKKIKAREALIQHLLSKPNIPEAPTPKPNVKKPNVKKPIVVNNANARSVKNLLKEARNSGFYVVPASRNQVLKVLARRSALNMKTTAQLKKAVKDYGIALNKNKPNRENFIQALKNVNFSKPPSTKKEKLPNLAPGPSSMPYVPIKKYKTKVNLAKTKIYELTNENLNRYISDIIGDVPPPPTPIMNKPIEVEPPAPAKSKMFSPRDYQLIVGNTLMTQKGIIAVHSIGSGKTLTSIIAADKLLKSGVVEHVIVISPKTLVRNFKKELDKQGFRDIERNCTFYSYQTAANHLRFPDKYKNVDGRLTDELISRSLVIFDEVHKLNTHISGEAAKKQVGVEAKTLTTHCRKAKRILGLTATPVVNEFKELKNMINMISGGNLNTGIFSKSSAKTYGEKYGPIFSFYERSIDDPNFPSYTVHRVKIPMNDEYYFEYKKIAAAAAAKHKYQSEAFYLNLRTASNEITDARNEKIEWILNDIVEKVTKKNQKCIIFSQFRESGIKILQKRLTVPDKDENGRDKYSRIRFVEITGDTDTNNDPNKDERFKAQEDYNSGKVNVIFLTKAGGEGIDLKMTDNVYIIEPTWNPAQLYQAIGRGVRLGSHSGAKGRGHVNAYCVSLSYSKKQYALEIRGPGRAKVIPKSVEDHLYDDILKDKFSDIDLFYKNFYPHSIGYGRITSENRPYFMKQPFVINNRRNNTFTPADVNKLKENYSKVLNKAKQSTMKLTQILQNLYKGQIIPFTPEQYERAMLVYKSKYGINYEN